jgi:HAD superfamily hydrolase (TIGR01509 family)
MAVRALIFDCDGTLAETEEAHRKAFNLAFAEAGLDWCWTVDRYRELLRVTGGRERIAHYMAEEGLSGVDIPALHEAKNSHYAHLVQSGAVALRQGVFPMMEAAQSAGVAIAIATTTTRSNLDSLIRATRLSGIDFAALVTGEDVVRKKPDPEVYRIALDRLSLPAGKCMAFEDSENGLLAARGAGLKTVVTPSFYSAGEDFSAAALVVPDLEGFRPWFEKT